MSRSVNKVILIGNVGKDPVIRYTAGGTAIATFPLATSEVWKDKDGNLKERTDWHNIVAWQRLAEIIQELVKKGTRLYIEGKLRSRSYEDREGKKRYITEIIAENMLILERKDREGLGTPDAGTPPPDATDFPDDAFDAGTETDEELPF